MGLPESDINLPISFSDLEGRRCGWVVDSMKYDWKLVFTFE